MIRFLAAHYAGLFGKGKLKKKSYSIRMRFGRLCWQKLDGLLKFGFLATAIFWICISVVYAQKVCDERQICQSRISELLTSPGNEVGDAIAGIAGALAFFWIIVTVLMQGKELAAQRTELRLARMEYRNLVATQQDQVEILNQGLVREAQREAKSEFDAIVNRILENCKPGKQPYWHFPEKTDRYGRPNQPAYLWDCSASEHIMNPDNSTEAKIDRLIQNVHRLRRKILEYDNLEDIRRPPIAFRPHKEVDDLERATELRKEFSSAAKFETEELRLHHLEDALVMILKKDFWSE